MRILVIPEDPLLDQYILKPIVERVAVDVGLVARVDVLQEPRLRGAGQALDPGMVEEIGTVIDWATRRRFARDCQSTPAASWAVSQSKKSRAA